MAAPSWISIEAAAELARVAPKTVKEWCEEDSLPHTTTPDGDYLVKRDAVVALPDPPPGTWQVVFSNASPKLTVFEREDRGNGIYIRFWRSYPDRKGGYNSERALADTIRYTETDLAAADGRKRVEAGEICREREEEVINRARVLHATWVDTGTDPGRQLDREEEGKTAADDKGGFTLARAFDRILDPDDGKYHKQDYRRAMRRMADEIAGYLPTETLLVEEITISKLRRIWKGVSVRKGDSGEGYRWAERMTAFVQATVNWLEAEGLVEGLRFPPWKSAYSRYWESRTGLKPPKPGKEAEGPRYTPEEAGALFQALDDPEVDPRMKLLLMSGGDQLRGGQVRRCMRSDLTRSQGGHWDLGTLEVPGTAQKKGVTLDVDPDLSAALDEAMENGGYLHVLEAAYRAGELDDYALFPRGRLRKSIAPLRESGTHEKPASRTALRKWMLKLEEVAGVEHQKGRLLHGLRRLATDIAPEFTADDRVLDSAGGWSKGSTTREALYQAKQSKKVAEKASELRRRVRKQYMEPEGSAGSRKSDLIKRLSEIEDPDLLKEIESVLDDAPDGSSGQQ